jgi:hypothetical protein
MFLAVQLKIQFLSKRFSFCFGIKRFPSDYLNKFFWGGVFFPRLLTLLISLSNPVK